MSAGLGGVQVLLHEYSHRADAFHVVQRRREYPHGHELGIVGGTRGAAVLGGSPPEQALVRGVFLLLPLVDALGVEVPINAGEKDVQGVKGCVGIAGGLAGRSAGLGAGPSLVGDEGAPAVVVAVDRDVQKTSGCLDEGQHVLRPSDHPGHPLPSEVQLLFHSVVLPHGLFVLRPIPHNDLLRPPLQFLGPGLQGRRLALLLVLMK
mmetsp:Transcript_39381/g.80342  ORF Transcript_39381/g.80342 Transcript_39381/m.80342 type:complete len:206 (-) Transcript_39381:758-1375(-)